MPNHNKRPRGGPTVTQRRILQNQAKIRPEAEVKVITQSRTWTPNTPPGINRKPIAHGSADNILLDSTSDEINTQAKVWKSKNQVEEEKFKRMIKLASHFCPKSTAIPWTAVEWNQFRKDTVQAEVDRLQQRIKERQTCKAAASMMSILSKFVEKKVFLDNRSAVLCQPTIWCVEPTRPIRANAEWPTREEFRYEAGNQPKGKGKIKKERFWPLPRENKGEISSWKTLSLLPALSPLDNVGRHRRDLGGYIYDHEWDEKDNETWLGQLGTLNMTVELIKDIENGCA